MFACFNQNEEFHFQGILMQGFGKSTDVDDVNGMTGEVTCNSSGNLLNDLLQNCILNMCNGRTLLLDL